MCSDNTITNGEKWMINVHQDGVKTTVVSLEASFYSENVVDS